VVKNRVHAAGNQTLLPIPATFKLRCYPQCYLWELSVIVASPGHHTLFTFQKYPRWGPPLTPSGKNRTLCLAAVLNSAGTDGL